jgi:phosphonopyruvate decarboxylase
MAIPTAAFCGALREQGIDFWAGVPCSYLKSLVSFAGASGLVPYHACSSEGEAIAVATGAWLAGRTPMVMLQNSGLGNCVNPLTSLVRTFDIPMILLVSHRGEAGRDAPQHRLMGRITYELLDLMGIETATLPPELEPATEVVSRLRARAIERSTAVALVVPKGSFEPYEYAQELPDWSPPHTSVIGAPSAGPPALVSRHRVLAGINASLRPEDLVVATTGMTARELCAIEDRAANFYMMGSMGCAAAIGLGLSLSRPQSRTIVIDGDGAFLMKLGTGGTIGHYGPGGLLHLVLDNRTYETTGGQPTVATSLSFPDAAAALGYRQVVHVQDEAALCALIEDFEPGGGPLFAYLRIAGGHLDGVPRVARTPQAIRDSFRRVAARD